MLTSTCFFDKAYVQSLRKLEPEERQELIQKFWPVANSSLGVFDDSAGETFLDCVTDELERCGIIDVSFLLETSAAQSPLSIFSKRNLSRPYGDVMKDLSSQYLNVPPIAIRRSIELAVRLWLTLNTHSADILLGSISAEGNPLEWDQNLALSQLVEKQCAIRIRFHGPETSPRFDAGFTAAFRP
ncbi:hypothetical protein EJ02DRAFT_209064 [Clathrospora elynae]|uniref:Uncharacterized protein n=1 Tax=Clathrospora elynae TaxID=706981 RepID=A0A6A5SNH0_9PLEO|nr:hypothetical protein EJ02DRAFT_209064 [Clathrospora elynae]